MGFRGVYNAPIGTTIRVASSRDEGQTFQLRRTPSRSSCAWMLLMSMVARRAAAFAGLLGSSTQALRFRTQPCSELVALQRQHSCGQLAFAAARPAETRVSVESAAIFLRRGPPISEV